MEYRPAAQGFLAPSFEEQLIVSLTSDLSKAQPPAGCAHASLRIRNELAAGPRSNSKKELQAAEEYYEQLKAGLLQQCLEHRVLHAPTCW